MTLFIAKAKWFLVALISGLSVVLSVLYGKRTAQVLRSRLAEVKAHEAVLSLELVAVENDARGTLQASDATRARTDRFLRKLYGLEKTRDRILEGAGTWIPDSGSAGFGHNAPHAHP